MKFELSLIKGLGELIPMLVVTESSDSFKLNSPSTELTLNNKINMDPSQVNPRAWDSIKIILNDPDHQYSIIFGNFWGKPCLGMRWNGKPHERGYPGQAGNPLWFVVPEPLERTILDEMVAIGNNSNVKQPALNHARQVLL